MSDTKVSGLASDTFAWVETPDDSFGHTPELFPEFYLLNLDAFMTSTMSLVITQADFAAVALWLSSHEVQLNTIWLQDKVKVQNHLLTDLFVK